jgi:hypothetical protein
MMHPRTDAIRFRAHALDGAMLYFEPHSGVHVRVRGPRTRHLRRSAPRVVMFGITNACNLRCEFCSRDTARPSSWTVGDAHSLLSYLARAGVLEVAFGGGEPFAFRGFSELVRLLARESALALHVTTNGTLLDDAMLAALDGALGQIRLSLYEGVPWRRAARSMLRAGQKWGANLLVDDDALPALPAMLDEIERLGAADASILSYVGAGDRRVLSARGRDALERIVERSPLPCRVSVCFGDALRVPRLFHGLDALDGERALERDCGAGADFITITSDRRLQACSFHDESFPIETADDVLRLWRDRRAALRRASPRVGCARAGAVSERIDEAGRARASDDRTEAWVWRSFSGNNSGECLLVGKFETVDDASRALDDLLPGFSPGGAYADEWKKLFADEGLIGDGEPPSGMAPEELLVRGRTLLARTDSAPGDDFPELRAFVWKRGGVVLPGGVHVHDGAPLLSLVRAHDRRDAEEIASRARAEGAVAALHACDVLAAFSPHPARPGERVDSVATLASRLALVDAWAGERPSAVEIFFDKVREDDLIEATKRAGTPPRDRDRLLASFFRYDPHADKETHARAFATQLDGAVTHVKNLVLVEDIVRKKRVAIQAQRLGAFVSALAGSAVEVHAHLWRNAPPPTKGTKAPAPEPIDATALTPALRAKLRHALGTSAFDATCEPAEWGGRVNIRVRTEEAAKTFVAIAELADALGVHVSLGANDVDELLRAFLRLRDDVEHATKR